MDAFDACLAFTLKEEGGCVDNSQDPGGCTNLGVTLAVYRDWMGDETLEPAALYACTNADVAPIYAANYWNRLRCDTMPLGVDQMLFDAGVNQGPSFAAKMLQECLGLRGANVDGWIGAQTIGLAHKSKPILLIHSLYGARMVRYRSLPGFKNFGKGWTARATACLSAAMRMQTVPTVTA